MSEIGLNLSTLSRKYRLFVEAYDGDVITAMLTAGFQGAPTYLEAKGNQLLEDPLIIEAIKERSRHRAKTFRVIADREERQALLTAVMRNEDPHWREEKDANGIPIPMPNLPIAARLKALETLGRSEGDYIDNVNHTGNVTLTDLVVGSYKVKESADEIEAEYREIREQAKLERQQKIEAPVESITGKYL